jgi:hypothetical protein
MTNSTEELAQMREKLEQISVPLTTEIPVQMMSGIGKLLKVVNNPDDHPSFMMRDSELEIGFDRPFYIHKVVVAVSTFQNVRGMKFLGFDMLAGKEVKISITPANAINGVSFSVSKVLTSFVLHRDSFFPKEITNIQIEGIFLNEIEKFEESHQDLLKFRENIGEFIDQKEKEFALELATIAAKKNQADIESKQAEDVITSLEEKKIVLTEEVTQLEETLAASSVVLDEQSQATGILSAKRDAIEKRNIAIASELEQNVQSLSSTNIAISDAEQKLKNLVGNINVFTEEFSGFVDQGTKQVRIYVSLAAVPLILLCVVVFNLFRGAVDLSTRFNEMPRIDLLTLFATRLPFVAIAALILGISVKVLFFLVNRIIAIHQQRLDLAKIAIIAKDVSDASAKDLGLTVDEQFDAKTYLKMSILRAYMSEQIEKFSYRSRTAKNEAHEFGGAGKESPSSAIPLDSAG